VCTIYWTAILISATPRRRGIRRKRNKFLSFLSGYANREAAHPADSSHGVWNFRRRRPNRSVRWIRFR
jgi:hypothetical protein